MKKILLTAAVAVCAMAQTFAIPAWRGLIKVKQPDGTFVSFYLHGDEHSHRCVTPDGYLLRQDPEGAYRYVTMDKEGHLIINESLLAHDTANRTPAEKAFVAGLQPAVQLSHMLPRGIAKAPAKSMGEEDMQKASRFQIGNYPTIGDGRCLVLLVNFTDLKFNLTKKQHERMLNEEGYSDNGATGSARDYYMAQSSGLYKPTFDVVGPLELPRAMNYYGADNFIQNDVNVSKMIVDACRAADEAGVDFSQYDGDGNGEVDMVYVIYAGYGQNAGAGENTIWPHKYNLTLAGESLTIDGKTIDTYACSAELFGNSGTTSAGIGTVCHEFGHVLGLADHYNTLDGTDYRLGHYDIMDYGAYNNNGNTPPSYNAFERMTLGWLTPDTLSTPQDNVTLGNIATANKAYLLTTSNPDEFFLLENRQKEGWDSYIMGTGMMITQVDYDEGYWNQNTLNNDASHPRFRLIPADNELGYDIILNKKTEAYDLFPAKHIVAFTDETTPAAQPWTGEKLDKWLTEITNTDGTVAFNFMRNHLQAPADIRWSLPSEESIKVMWNPVDRATSYEAKLYELDFRSAQPVALSEDFSLMTYGSTTAPAADDISQKLDQYTQAPGWTGTNVHQASGWCSVGSETGGGSLNLPKVNVKRFDGKYAVAVTVKAMDGKQPVLTVSSNGQSGRTRINSIERTYIFNFTGGISSTDISVATNMERALIDCITVLRGDDMSDLPADAKVITVSGEPAVTEGETEDRDFIHVSETTASGITDLEYTFSGLKPQHYYSFCIKAIGDNAASQLSDEVVVFTGMTTDVSNPADASFDSGEHIQIFTLGGLKVSSMQHPGIYIVKQGDKVKKIMKRQ